MKAGAPETDMRALASILEEEYRAADQYRESLQKLEDMAFKFYEAQPFGNENEGRSQIVIPDVQEAIDYMVPSILRTFVSGDRTVEFEAVDEDDKQLADDATAAINWTFMRRQDGYRILHDGCHDGLLRKLGIFKTVMETQQKVSCQKVTIDPLMLGEMGDDVELEDEPVDNGDGTVTVELKTTRSEKRFVDYAIAPANFRFSPRARHEDEADYLCHVDWEKTRSDLVEMGFDPEQVKRLPAHTGIQYNEVESNQLDQYRDVESSAALQKVQLCEEYARIDIDGDGIAERVKVFRVADEILIDAETGKPSIEVVDEQPFSVFCPYPRPHRIAGYSLAEKVMDIQLLRSYFARQLADGMALSNTPRPVVDMSVADQQTMEALLNPIPGSPIPVRGGIGAVQPYQTGFNAGQSLQVMEWLVGEKESRTGITRLNQGLDADTLNKTATGAALMQSQGQQQEEYIARGLAETLSRLFMKKYRLMRKESEPFSVKVDGQYRRVDPSQWPEDINITVRVGLGTGSKDRRVQGRMALAEPLAAAVQTGMADHRHVFNWFDGVARDMGVGQGDDYCIDPDAPPEVDPATGQPKVKEQKHDPEMAKVQAEAQKEQAKLAGEQRLSELRQQLQREEAQAKQQLAREQAEFEAKLSTARARHEADLAEAKLAMEERLAEQRMIIEANLARHKAELTSAVSDAGLTDNRAGGRLDA